MKKRWLRVGMVFLALVGLGTAYLLLYRRLGVGLPCFFYRLTGLQCPGCGMTRAIEALLRGSLREALGYNLLFPLYLVWGAWVLGWGTVRYLRGLRNPFLPGPLWIHLTVLCVVFTNWILLNLC